MKQEASQEDVLTVDSAIGGIIDTFSALMDFSVKRGVMHPGIAVNYLGLAMSLCEMRVAARRSYPKYFSENPAPKTLATPDFASIDLSASLRDLLDGK